MHAYIHTYIHTCIQTYETHIHAYILSPRLPSLCFQQHVSGKSFSLFPCKSPQLQKFRGAGDLRPSNCCSFATEAPKERPLGGGDGGGHKTCKPQTLRHGSAQKQYRSLSPRLPSLCFQQHVSGKSFSLFPCKSPQLQKFRGAGDLRPSNCCSFATEAPKERPLTPTLTPTGGRAGSKVVRTTVYRRLAARTSRKATSKETTRCRTLRGSLTKHSAAPSSCT